MNVELFGKLNETLNKDLRKIVELEMKIKEMKKVLPKSFLYEVDLKNHENFGMYIDSCYNELQDFNFKLENEEDESDRQFILGLIMAYSKLLGAMDQYHKSIR